MGKEELVNYLREKGFIAELVSGLPTVYVSDIHIAKDIKKEVKECNYYYSFAVKQVAGQP